MISGGHLVAKFLKREGIDVVFTLSGGHIAPIYQGCLEEGLRLIDVRHEQAAAHAADAWARLTRQPGVALVTAGPGVTDAVTGVVNAQQADSPLLLIGGQAPRENFEMGALQEMNHVELLRPVTKWSRSVPFTQRIPEYLSIAFRQALADRPGPVFVEIPVDLLLEHIEEHEVAWPEKYRVEARSSGDPRQIQSAAALLERSQRAVAIAGSAVWWSDAAAELRAFAQRAAIPVYLNAMGRGSLPPDHPQFFALTRKYALGRADLVLIIGTPLDFRLNYGRPPLFAPEATIVQIDVDQASLGRNRPIEVGIVGDARAILRQLTDAVAEREPDVWQAELRDREQKEWAKLAPLMNSDGVPIHPLRLLEEVRAFIDPETIVIGDGGNIVAQAGRVIHVPRPGHWLDPGRFGCLGIGVPFALAAQALHPSKRVLIIQGDGAFGLNGFEFDTAVRHQLPVISVVGNNAAWGQIRGPQIAFYGEEHAVATALAQTRYDRVVEALGGHGEFVQEPSQIRPALERAYASGLPACVNVLIDPQANAAVSAGMMVI